MSYTVSDLIVETLERAGVRRVYGIPGDSLNGFTDALHKSGTIAWQHVRHEESVAFAAAADAGITGELAVCAASCGPGNLHLINGLYDAHRSRVPVLAVAAHIPSKEIGGSFGPDHDLKRLEKRMATTVGSLRTLRQPELLGKTVVLIGGSSGMGLETARRARSEGADVIITGRNQHRLRSAAEELGGARSVALTTRRRALEASL